MRKRLRALKKIPWQILLPLPAFSKSLAERPPIVLSC